MKYGALSRFAGRIRVEWSLKDGGRLHLRWTETGGPRVTALTKEGFGTRAITRMLGQLDGEVKFEWREEGMICEIVVAT